MANTNAYYAEKLRFLLYESYCKAKKITIDYQAVLSKKSEMIHHFKDKGVDENFCKRFFGQVDYNNNFRSSTLGSLSKHLAFYQKPENKKSSEEDYWNHFVDKHILHDERNSDLAKNAPNAKAFLALVSSHLTWLAQTHQQIIQMLTKKTIQPSKSASQNTSYHFEAIDTEFSVDKVNRAIKEAMRTKATSIDIMAYYFNDSHLVWLDKALKASIKIRLLIAHPDLPIAFYKRRRSQIDIGDILNHYSANTESPEIRFLTADPSQSIFHIQNVLMYVGTNTGYPIPTQATKGYKRPMFHLKPNTEEFKNAAEEFELFWQEAVVFDNSSYTQNKGQYLRDAFEEIEAKNPYFNAISDYFFNPRLIKLKSNKEADPRNYQNYIHYTHKKFPKYEFEQKLAEVNYKYIRMLCHYHYKEHNEHLINALKQGSKIQLLTANPYSAMRGSRLFSSEVSGGDYGAITQEILDWLKSLQEKLRSVKSSAHNLEVRFFNSDASIYIYSITNQDIIQNGTGLDGKFTINPHEDDFILQGENYIHLYDAYEATSSLCHEIKPEDTPLYRHSQENFYKFWHDVTTIKGFDILSFDANTFEDFIKQKINDINQQLPPKRHLRLY